MSLSRRQFIVLSASSAALSAIPLQRLLAQAGQAPAAPPKTEFMPIQRNVGYFTGRGGTIGWLSNKDALIVIDTQFPDTAKLCIDGLKTRASRGIDLVINTHHHGDHTGGNGVFKDHAKRILAHSRVPELLQKFPGQAAPPTPPTETFDKQWGEDAGDEKISARHYGPAHTGGDAVIHFERANVVHMGDLLFHYRHPFVDRPAGASIQNWLKTVETVANEMPADTKYIAGHAKEGMPVLVSKQDLLRQRDYFDAVLSYVKKAMAEGKSKDEVMKVEALPKFEDYQGGGRLTAGAVLGVAFDELSEK